ncbi:MAG: leucine-rich repeat domain-containing protein [Promethearchaeota archaeon]
MVEEQIDQSSENNHEYDEPQEIMNGYFKILKSGMAKYRKDQIPLINTLNNLLNECLMLAVDKDGYVISFKVYNLKVLELPDRFDEWIRLRYFYILKGNLESLPPSLGKCKHLIKIEVVNCHLTTVPPEIGQLSHLRCLFLQKNRINYLPDELKDIGCNLKGKGNEILYINLFENHLLTIPLCLIKIKNLHWLDLGSNEISEFPDYLNCDSLLQKLNLNNNKIHDLPLFLKKWNLLSVKLDDNPLNKIPKVLFQSPQLFWLSLKRCKIHKLPSNLINWQNIQHLDLSGNYIKKFPKNRNMYLHLEDLYLQDNKITKLPKKIFNMPKIQTIRLKGNHIKNIPILGENLIDLEKN